jgi:hypothetical protein
LKVKNFRGEISFFNQKIYYQEKPYFLQATLVAEADLAENRPRKQVEK